jgi:hypothetical protein
MRVVSLGDEVIEMVDARLDWNYVADAISTFNDP